MIRSHKKTPALEIAKRCAPPTPSTTKGKTRSWYPAPRGAVRNIIIAVPVLGNIGIICCDIIHAFHPEKPAASSPPSKKEQTVVARVAPQQSAPPQVPPLDQAIKDYEAIRQDDPEYKKKEEEGYGRMRSLLTQKQALYAAGKTSLNEMGTVWLSVGLALQHSRPDESYFYVCKATNTGLEPPYDAEALKLFPYFTQDVAFAEPLVQDLNSFQIIKKELHREGGITNEILKARLPDAVERGSSYAAIDLALIAFEEHNLEVMKRWLNSIREKGNKNIGPVLLALSIVLGSALAAHHLANLANNKDEKTKWLAHAARLGDENAAKELEALGNRP